MNQIQNHTSLYRFFPCLSTAPASLSRSRIVSTEVESNPCPLASVCISARVNSRLLVLFAATFMTMVKKMMKSKAMELELVKNGQNKDKQYRATR